MKHNIGLQLKKRARISTHTEAFVEFERGRRFTFEQLNLRCNRIANALVERGVKPGDRVATLLKNGIEFIETYFATAKIGAVLVPVNWRLVAREVNYILDDSGATSLIYDADFDDTIAQLHNSDTLGISRCIRVNAIDSEAALPEYAEDYDAMTATASDAEPAIGAGDDDLVFIMYTSGTTGHPKGVMHSHRCMLWAELTSLTTSDMRGEDRFLLPMPMFHVGAMVPVSQLVHRGGTGIIMRDIDMGVMFRAIQEENVTITMSVPAFACDIASLAKTSKVSSLRTFPS